VVAVTDGSHLSRAGRVMPLAVVLLLCTSNSAQPGMTGPPPAQPAVMASLTLQHGSTASLVAMSFWSSRLLVMASATDVISRRWPCWL
jgi:hypothetical protein